MAIDYSKWDKLELSDDSDIEVHPNVDKTSFIKWKQRDIHEKRIQRENEIKGLKVQKEMYTQLNKRMDNILSNLNDEQLLVATERNAYMNSKFDKNEKCTLEPENEDVPTYNEMIEDLFSQMEGDIKKENLHFDAENLKLKLKEHRAKVDDTLKQIDPKIKEFEADKTKHITSEDIHEGWNSSFINKKNQSDATEAAASASAEAAAVNTPTDSLAASTTTAPSTIETLNSPKAATPLKRPSKPLSELGELELLPETEQYLALPTVKASGAFIVDHPFIACVHQKDAVVMKAFDYELNDDHKTAQELIHKGMILQFCADILENAPDPNMPLEVRLNYVKQLFVQLEKDNSPGKMAFDQEVAKLVNHVSERCKIIKQEAAEEDAHAGEDGEQVEQIQLRSMDPNSELIVTIPEEGTPEYEAFQDIPDKMKEALKTGSLDAVNEVFATMHVDEAEELLEKFNESGVIGVQALLDNEKQFEELKENQKKFEQMQKAAEGININDKLNELVD
jgi:cell division cycle protein 37